MRKHDHDLIVNLYVKEKLSINQIALKLDIPSRSVNYILRKYKVTRPKPKSICDHNFFEKIDAEEKAYWLGFLAADGCIYVSTKKYATQNTIIIGLSLKDLGHLKKFNKSLKSKSKIRIATNKSGYIKNAKFCETRISSKKMTEDLAKLGLRPRKTFDLKPSDVASGLEKHYWRGLVDGDGWISKSSRPQLVLGLVGTKEICKGFLKWCQKYTDTKTSVRKHYSIWQIKITDRHAIKIAEILYGKASVYLSRKYNTYRRDFCGKT